MLSAHQSQHEVQAAKDSGANGYALKHAGREALVGSVKDILAGMAVFPDSGEKVTEENALVDLTRRERQVLKLLAEGYKNQEIASLLFISSRTVEKHRASLIEKLGVSSLHDLIDVARQAGLLQ